MVGVDPKQISRIEGGKSAQSLDTLEAIAKRLQVEMKDLFDFRHLVPEERIEDQKDVRDDELGDYDDNYSAISGTGSVISPFKGLQLGKYGHCSTSEVNVFDITMHEVYYFIKLIKSYSPSSWQPSGK